MPLNPQQEELCTSSRWDFSDLRALFVNCTLKRSPELSHTQGLVEISKAIMEKNGVIVEVLRPVDYEIAAGVYPDMTKHGWARPAPARPIWTRGRALQRTTLPTVIPPS